MKKIGSLDFRAELFLERSVSPVKRSIGVKNNTMTLYMDEDRQSGIIEWEYGEEDVEVIGIWIEGKRVVDFDGVFSLPNEAKKLLNNHGYVVSKDLIL